MFKVSLLCACAFMIFTPINAEEEVVVDPVEFEAFDDFDIEDDEDYLFDDLAYMEDDEMYEDIYFEDEDEFDAMTATDISEQEMPLEIPTNIS